MLTARGKIKSRLYKIGVECYMNLEEIRKQKVNALSAVPELKKGNELAWLRKMVKVTFDHPIVSDYWQEIVKANGLQGLLEETLEKVLSSDNFIPSTDSDRKAYERTMNTGSILYMSDFTRMVNAILSGRLK